MGEGMQTSQAGAPAGLGRNDPYCSNCGYVLKGLTESSKCPECGKPLVEVLVRPGQPWANAGKRYRSKATLFGWPVIDVAVGPKDGEMRGHAKGIIAVGDIATGGIALGGMARGIVAVGGMAIGLFALGGGAIGLVSATGGMAAGALAAGGGAIGYFAAGGGALGVVAQGGGAFGLYTRDGRSFGPGNPAAKVFEEFSWFFGGAMPGGDAMMRPMLVTVCVTLAAAAVIGLIAWLRLLREGRDTP
jgi:hypothetical protein